MIVLGPTQAFLEGIHTVQNLYRRTHSVSCLANVGEASHPSTARVRTVVARAFTLRVAVVEYDASGMEQPYDLSGMSLLALVRKYSGYDVAEVAPAEHAVTAEIPSKLGLMKVAFASTDLASPGSYSVEIVDVLAEEIPSEDPEEPATPPEYASICRVEMELVRP